MTPFGLLNLNKPPGITSRAAVNQVQRLVRPAKIGHAGTLDPLASGVLVVPVGPATRLVDYVQQLPKTYVATFLLGRHSATEDSDGDVILLRDPPVPAPADVAKAAKRFVGQIEQRPPAFSALKVAGRRAYDLARRGEAVHLEPRSIMVHRIDVLQYEYPELTLRIECGSGTYVRSLGRDMAEALGTAAVMSALVRTAIGRFTVDGAVAPEQLAADTWLAFLRPPLEAVAHLPQVRLTADQVARVHAGQMIPLASFPADAELAATNTSGRLVSILRCRGGDRWSAKLNFPVEA
jgi:tRNA pseudouridine55 synthase